MTITLAEPTADEILLDAATTPARATMHTSPIAARNLRHGSLFQMVKGSMAYRAVGSAHQFRRTDGALVVHLDVVDSDGNDWQLTFGINASVHGVVGAI